MNRRCFINRASFAMPLLGGLPLCVHGAEEEDSAKLRRKMAEHGPSLARHMVRFSEELDKVYLSADSRMAELEVLRVFSEQYSDDTAVNRGREYMPPFDPYIARALAYQKRAMEAELEGKAGAAEAVLLAASIVRKFFMQYGMCVNIPQDPLVRFRRDQHHGKGSYFLIPARHTTGGTESKTIAHAQVFGAQHVPPPESSFCFLFVSGFGWNAMMIDELDRFGPYSFMDMHARSDALTNGEKGIYSRPAHPAAAIAEQHFASGLPAQAFMTRYLQGVVHTHELPPEVRMELESALEVESLPYRLEPRQVPPDKRAAFLEILAPVVERSKEAARPLFGPQFNQHEFFNCKMLVRLAAGLSAIDGVSSWSYFLITSHFLAEYSERVKGANFSRKEGEFSPYKLFRDTLGAKCRVGDREMVNGRRELGQMLRKLQQERAQHVGSRESTQKWLIRVRQTMNAYDDREMKLGHAIREGLLKLPADDFERFNTELVIRAKQAIAKYMVTTGAGR